MRELVPRVADMAYGVSMGQGLLGWTGGRPARVSARALATLLGAVALFASCGVVKAPDLAVTTTLPPLQVEQTLYPTAVPVPTTIEKPPLVYVFPFTGKVVSYGHEHHDYPATDVFGCGAGVVAPIWGTITEIRAEDPWDPAVDNPSTRGGKYITLVGGDDVRYYFAHLESIAVAVGDSVNAGDALGVMGQTGNARNSECHTHLGISRRCPNPEWAIRRGEIFPWPFLDAWRAGDTQSSPSLAVYAAITAVPEACIFSENSPESADA